MSTVSAHVAVTLARSVSTVFGVIGNGNAFFIDALLGETKTRYVAVRHEAGAVVAADAHFRAGGGIAAATTTYGPGYTNTLTSLIEAAQARIPLVLVVGDHPSSGPRPWDVDQAALAAVVGVETLVAGIPDAAAVTVAALEHALAASSPVVLAIPYDLRKAEAGPVPILPAPRRPEPVPLDNEAQAEIAAAAREIAAAERPFLLAGRGAWLAGASDALGALAEATHAITATTALGRGLFPNAQFDLGVAGGFGAEGAMRLVHQADVAVVFGASLNQFTMRFGHLFAPDTRVIQIDVADSATSPRVDRFIRGDARIVASALADGVRLIQARPIGWRDSVDLCPLREYPEGEEFAADGRLDPRPVARRIAELLPEDRVVVSDGGHFIGWANMYWPVASPDRMVMVGTAFQSIGQGFPSVAGAAAARPDAAIVLTTGDGGGLMALADLETAVRVAGGHGLCIVWNDAAYGAEVNLYGLQGLAQEPMLIPYVDFASFAPAVGAEGVIIRTLADLARLASWVATPAANRRFLLLDVRVSTSVIAPYQREIIRVNS